MKAITFCEHHLLKTCYTLQIEHFMNTKMNFIFTIFSAGKKKKIAFYNQIALVSNLIKVVFVRQIALL